MRTTIDIDDDVLQAIEERAKAENKTAGQVLSGLVRQELARMSSMLTLKDGIPILRSRGGVITQEEIDLEEMQRAIGEPRSNQ